MPTPSILRTVVQAKTPPSSGEREPTLGTDETRTPPNTSGNEHHPDILLENAPVALAMFDDQMRYLVANRMWVEEFGLQQVTPLVGRSQFEVFPSLHPGWKQVYERALQGHVVRSEHDALSGQKGESIVYRWEVRPWRRRTDASVGGLMVSCEKYPGPTKADKAPLPSESKTAPVGAPLKPNESLSNGLFDSCIPILLLDVTGKIQKANVSALGPVLSKGVQEGVTYFWSAYGNGVDPLSLRDRSLAAIHRVATSKEPATEIVTISRSGAAESENGEEAPLPSRWLLTRPGGAPGNQVFALALGNEEKAMERPASSSQDSGLAEELHRARQETAILRDVEAAFAKRESRQRAVLDSLSCGLVVLNERGVPIHHNEHIAKLLGRGLQHGENVETWLLSACPTEDHKKSVSAVWSNDIWRRQLTRVLSLATADGLLKELEFRPVSLAGGGLLISIHDVTDTCRMEEQLRSNEAKFRTLLNETPIGVVLIDKNGAIFEANPPAERLLRRSKGELRRINSENWLTPESVAKRREGLRVMRDEGRRSTVMDVNILRPDGSEQEASLRIALVPDAVGDVHTAIHFLQAREPVGESSLPRSDAFPNKTETSDPNPTLIEAPKPPSILWLLQTDGSGRITHWSDDAVARFGFVSTEAQGGWLHGLFRPSDPTGFYADMQARIAVPEEAFEWTYYGKGGLKGSGRFFAKGAAEGGNSIDLFEEKAAPVEKPNLPAPSAAPLTPGTHLIRPVSQWPVADLDREKLLLSETHHRIKNHLQIISSMLNLQMNTLTDQPARDVLRSSQNRVRSIAALHQHLYQLVLDEGPDFAEFARGLAERLRECYDVSEEQVSLTLDISSGALDHEWMMPLALILNETLSNAFEYAFPEGRKGAIRVRLTLENGIGEFIVGDNGIGLPENFDSATASGLGLKILGVFAEQMRGELRLSGVPNGGTEFNLRFPMAHIDN
jgi:PAS domain S-box-containing protein